MTSHISPNTRSKIKITACEAANNIARELIAAATAWEPDTRLVGNVRADAVVWLCHRVLKEACEEQHELSRGSCVDDLEAEIASLCAKLHAAEEAAAIFDAAGHDVPTALARVAAAELAAQRDRNARAKVESELEVALAFKERYRRIAAQAEDNAVHQMIASLRAELSAVRERLSEFETPGWQWNHKHTGIAASWCPECGECSCDLDDGGFDKADCPLHGDKSRHCDDGATAPHPSLSDPKMEPTRYHCPSCSCQPEKQVGRIDP